MRTTKVNFTKKDVEAKITSTKKLREEDFSNRKKWKLENKELCITLENMYFRDTFTVCKWLQYESFDEIGEANNKKEFVDVVYNYLVKNGYYLANNNNFYKEA